MNRIALTHARVARARTRRIEKLRSREKAEQKILLIAHQDAELRELANRLRGRHLLRVELTGHKLKLSDGNGVALFGLFGLAGVLLTIGIGQLVSPNPNVSFGWFAVAGGVGILLMAATHPRSRVEFTLSAGDDSVSSLLAIVSSPLTSREERSRAIRAELRRHPSRELVYKPSLWSRLVRRGA